MRNPMKLAIVRGSTWEDDPEAAKEAQHRGALTAGLVFIGFGLVLIVTA